MDVKQQASPVDRAVVDIKKATDRLIKLLVSRDDLISVKAHCALRDLDPPPIGALADAIIQSRDPRVRARVAGVLGAAADADRMRVMVILGHAFQAELDKTVKLAVVDAMLCMKPLFAAVAKATVTSAPNRG